jgi:signal transduction histidine kinase
VTTPADEARVDAIAAYEVLDGSPQPAGLHALTELAAMVSGVPMAAINLITGDQQHQLAAVGFDPVECRREDSMCAAVLDEPGPVVVADAREDDRFRDNPFVTGELGRTRFYASHRLVTPDGTTIGRLCVFDEQPREGDASRHQALAALAGRVVDVLELELARRRLEDAHRQVAEAETRLATFASQVGHDLKNPLSAISMSLEMAREEAGAADRTVSQDLLDLRERAGRSTARMQSMIDEILVLARGGAP